MTDIEHKRKKARELAEGNLRSYEELRKEVPQFAMDTSEHRQEMFMAHLMKWGIVTEDQVLDFEIEFHTSVEEALNGQWTAYREAREAAKKPQLAVVKERPKKLTDAQGRPLT